MTIELYTLLFIALFAASMWVPYIVGVNTAPAGSLPKDPTDFTRPPNPADQRPWVHRAYRAHLNLLEQATPFAMVVVLAHIVGVSSMVTLTAALAFAALRIVHAYGMISGRLGFPGRPIVFTA